MRRGDTSKSATITPIRYHLHGAQQLAVHTVRVFLQTQQCGRFALHDACDERHP